MRPNTPQLPLVTSEAHESDASSMPGASGAGKRWGFEIVYEYKARSYSNLRAHWTAVSRWKREDKEAIAYAWVRAGRPKPSSFPAVVTFTRCGRGLLDDDNLPHAFKYARDELCRLWGLTVGQQRKQADDGDSGRLKFRYEQARAPTYSVRVRVEGVMGWIDPGHCKSCRAPIFWVLMVPNKEGKKSKMIVDRELVYMRVGKGKGRLVLEDASNRGHGRVVAGELLERDHGARVHGLERGVVAGYQAHWATCPHRKEHRRK